MKYVTANVNVWITSTVINVVSTNNERFFINIHLYRLGYRLVRDTKFVRARVNVIAIDASVNHQTFCAIPKFYMCCENCIFFFFSPFLSPLRL